MASIREYHDMEILLHYNPEKGHNGIDMEEAIQFLYRVLDETPVTELHEETNCGKI